jgi:hypothetical protein
MAYIRSPLAFAVILFGLVLTTPIVLLCLPFWIVGFLTHRLCRLLEPKTVSWEEVIQFDPVLGWKPKANLNTYCSFAAGMFRVQTDSLGWSGRSTLAESEIVVFGDSFAFGFGVNAEKMFSELNPKLRIKSIGAPGYNMVQELILMQQLSAQLRNKLVVWLICLSNDLYDNLLPNLYQYRMPFVRRLGGTERWEIATSHVNRKTWSFNPKKNSRRNEKLDGTFANSFLSRRVYSGCEFLIEKGKDLCAHSGASLVVMTIPWTMQLDRREWDQVFSRIPDSKTFDPELPDKQLAAICSKLNVPLIAGKDHLELRHFIAGEGHWNESGHRRVGEILGELYHHYKVERGPNRESRCAALEFPKTRSADLLAGSGS